jgi:hypothetical protein
MKFRLRLASSVSATPRVTIRPDALRPQVQHTALWMDQVVEIMRDKKQPGSARAQAAGHILDRGWGRPAQAVAIDITTSRLMS